MIEREIFFYLRKEDVTFTGDDSQRKHTPDPWPLIGLAILGVFGICVIVFVF